MFPRFAGVRPRRVHHPRGEPLRRDGGDRLPERAAGAARGQAKIDDVFMKL